MKKVSMTRGVIAFVIVFLFLAGVAWWSYEEEDKNEQAPSRIEIVEQNDRSKLVKNYDAGFEVDIPSDWRIDETKTQFYTQKTLNDGGTKVSCSSEGQEFDSLDRLKENLIENMQEIYGDEFDLVRADKVDNPFEMLEFEINNYFGNVFSIYFLKNNKSYSCNFYSKSKDQKLIDNFVANLKVYEK